MSPPQEGGGAVSSAPQLFLWQNRMLVNVTIYLYTICLHHHSARIPDEDAMPLCVLASLDGPRGTISTKPFSCPHQLVFRCENCLVLAQRPHQKSAMIAFPPPR